MLSRRLSRCLALGSLSLLVTLVGCAGSLPTPPDGYIDRTPFTLVVPLVGDQAPETEGGPVHAVRWTVTGCSDLSGTSTGTHRWVMGTRGTTSADALPPRALAALVVCEAHTDGTTVLHKLNVHHGENVSAYRYEPMPQPFLVLEDNTLEILGFEPGKLDVTAQPESETGPVGEPHRFHVTIQSGDDFRQKVSDYLAQQREKAATSATTGRMGFAPSVLHSDY